jgi:NitT/TauT family transport system ATP-binding protein
MAIFAPSGAGKTTLIKILAGIESADSGRFILADTAPVTLFQEPRLFPFLTVEENIFLPFKIAGRSVDSEVQRRYQTWLEVCELKAFMQHYPYQLSGGMRQKVALIRGLLGKPRFVMMDEPFQSINGASKQAIIAHIIETMPELSILFVTHIAEEIPLLAQTVLYFPSPWLSRSERLPASALQRKLSAVKPLFITDEINHHITGAYQALNVNNKEIL